MGYKKYIDKNHYVRESMGDDLLNGISDGIKVGKMLGLDKQVQKDVKRLKGFNDAEISEMDLAVLRKECKRFHTRFIVLAICAAVMIMASLANIEAAFGTILLGIISAVVSFRDYKQYKKFKAKIDEYYK